MFALAQSGVCAAFSRGSGCNLCDLNLFGDVRIICLHLILK